MSPKLLHGTVTLAVLANYVALLTVGQSLHEHGASPALPSEAAACSHAAHFHTSHHWHLEACGPQDQSQGEHGEQAADLVVDPVVGCLICQFLSQKPIPVEPVQAVISSPLAADVETLAPCFLAHPFPRCRHIRGPPTVV
jgi:hypothetical protein